MYKLCCIVFFCFWPFVSISNANEPSSWPAFMGPDRNGLVAARGVFAEGGFSLKKDWIVDLGSGYSGISIAQNIAVTMYSDHQSDYVLALNATTGKKIWQYLLGPTYKGHGNSQDGPLSTPSIDQNVVFCLSPFANLVALDLATGDLRWQVDLIKEFNAPAPHWGFVTSPLLCDGVLVVLAGLAENGLLIGFDSRTGEKLWQGGHDVVRYQSPTRGLLNGRDVVLAAGDEELFCLNPKTGEILWQYAADGGFIDSNTPLIISPDKILVQTAQNGLQLLGIQEVDGTSAVDIIWENSRVNRSYSLPLVYGDQIYVYSGRFLSCISTDTGQINWKSRAPGDGFMIGVGQYLVILTKQGWIHVAATDPQAYKENAALKLFDDLAWTHPSFYDGKIYARSYGQIACIGVDKGKRIASSSSSALASQSNFLNWINKVKSANPEEKSILVNQYMAETKTFPIIEPDGLVHFVYQGDADDLALSGDHVGLWDERPMQRLEDTDIFYASYYLELDARLKYRYIKNLEEKILDPLNPIEVEDTMGGESEFFSWLTMPNWSAATFAVLDQSHRGGIETRYMTSTILADQRGMDIYLPPGYRQTDKDYPVAYLHMGKGAQQFGAINRVVDQLIKDKKIEALILVLVHENASGFYREELVRGADLIGTPLTTFSQVSLADDQSGIFNGICGAESGGVPVSAVSPSLLINQVEVQKKTKSQERPPILAVPQDTSGPNTL